MTNLLPTADVLSAAALALAALTVMYSLWMPAITQALGQTKERHRDDRDQAIEVLNTTKRRTARPLAWATTCLLAVLTPSTFAVLWESGHHLYSGGAAAMRDYQPVLAVYLVVWVFLASLTELTWLQVLKLARRHDEFSRPDKKSESGQPSVRESPKSSK